jgi:hypothetical protein
LSKVHVHHASLQVRTDRGARSGLKLPEAKRSAYGKISNLGGGGRYACLSSDREDGEWESLVIDLDGNKDLTDDPAGALRVGEEVSEIVVRHGGVDRGFRLKLVSRDQYESMTLSPLNFLKGGGTVGTDRVAWHVADCNLSGRIDEGDAAYITFDDRPWERYRGHMVILDATSAVREDGRWYGVGWRKEGNGLEIRPFRGEMHTLTVDATKVAPGASDVRCHFVRYGMGRSARMFNSDLVAGVALPSGRLGYLSGLVKTAKGQVNFVMRGLVLDKDTSLEFGKPSARLVLLQRGNEILVSQNCIAPHNVVYTLARGKVGPKVELFAPGDAEKPVSSGNMEYG